MSRTIEKWNSFADDLVNILKRETLLFGPKLGAFFGCYFAVSRPSLGTPTLIWAVTTFFCKSWSRSRWFQVSCRSRRLQVSVTANCLGTLNNAKKWLSKTSVIQRVFYFCICR